ncbi:IS110 family transposase [Rickettsia gravesii]|uniref:IS110 family transposase n=1 Tax=Rickettsia gravesii TaxID=354585 RepID=UPI000360EB06|nr:transposase [Rickettsia gravesii]
MIITYIGVDVDKKTLNIYIPIINTTFTVNNNEPGFSKLREYLIRHYVSLQQLVNKSTGGYEQQLRKFLKQNSISFTTVHPNKVRNYAKAKGWLAKTDNIDSKLLHDYATVFKLPIKCQHDNENQERLGGLLKRREQLILFKTQEVGRLDTEHNQVVIQSLNDHLSSLTKQIEKIDNHKPPKVALVAVMRKLLAFMHSIIKNDSFWIPDFVNSY